MSDVAATRVRYSLQMNVGGAQVSAAIEGVPPKGLTPDEALVELKEIVWNRVKPDATQLAIEHEAIGYAAPKGKGK